MVTVVVEVPAESRALFGLGQCRKGRPCSWPGMQEGLGHASF